MTVRVYSHDTAAVPWTYGANGYPMLKAILVACLVTGTGGIPGAGWGLVAESGGATGYFVLRNAAADLFICFTYQDFQYVKISIARSFEGVDSNGFIVGEAGRSGLLPGFSAWQRLRVGFLGGAAANSQAGWCVVADGAAFAFTSSSADSVFSGAGMDTTSVSLTGTGQTFGAGRSTRGRAYFVGGSSSNLSFCGLDLNCTYIEHPSTGLLLPSADTLPAFSLSSRSVPTGFSTGTDVFTYEDLPSVNGLMHVDRLGIIGGVRGFLFLPTVQQGYYRHVLRRLGMAPNFDTMQPRDIAQLVLGADGFRYAYCKTTAGTTPTSHATPCLVTDNPRVW